MQRVQQETIANAR